MHTHSHTQNDLPGGKKTRNAQGEMKNKIIPGRFFIIVGDYVHITYKAIAKSVQGSSLRGEEKNLGKNSTVA